MNRTRAWFCGLLAAIVAVGYSGCGGPAPTSIEDLVAGDVAESPQTDHGADADSDGGPNGAGDGAARPLEPDPLPHADPGPDQSAPPGATVTLDARGSTGVDLRFRWRQIAGPGVALSSYAAAVTRFTIPTEARFENKTLSFRLTVYQGTAFDGETVHVLVGELPDAGAGPPDDPHDVTMLDHPRRFLAFTAGNADFRLVAEADKWRFYDRMVIHWSAGVISASTALNWQVWSDYRQELLARNPSAIIGPGFSSITTQNPLNVWEYEYPAYLFDPDGNFLGYDPVTYVARLDDEAFYSPALIDDYNSPRPPAPFGLWPFYRFHSDGWVLPWTVYISRPVIDIAHPQVISFVQSTMVDVLARHANANAVCFDNSAMYRNRHWNTWPGKGGGGRYDSTPPDADFLAYLDAVRATLMANGAKLACNTGDFRLLAGHADALFYEHGIIPGKPAGELREWISDFKYAVDHGTKVMVRFHRDTLDRPIDHDPAALMFYLAGTMLFYENDMVGSDFMMPKNTAFYYYPQYFELPDWLGEPLGGYVEFEPYAFSREFENGIVVLNADDAPVAVTDADYAALNFAEFAIPRMLSAKQGIVRLRDCAKVTSDGNCAGLYEVP
jgi:hypothetical protein